MFKIMMWMLPLYLHVNQKSDYDDMMIKENKKDKKKNLVWNVMSLIAGVIFEISDQVLYLQVSFVRFKVINKNKVNRNKN